MPVFDRLQSKLRRGPALCGLLLSCFAGPLMAGISGLDGNKVPWEHLHFDAERGIAKLTLDIDLSPLSADFVKQSLGARGQLPAATPPGGAAFELRAVIQLRSIFARYSTDDRIWLQGSNIGVFEREKLRGGSKHYLKTFRYTPGSAYRLRVRPDDKAQGKLPPAQWTDHKFDRYRYGAAGKSCPVVSEPGALFYLIGAHDFGNGKPVDLCVFSDSALFRMRVQPMGTEQIKVNYKLTQNGNTRRIAGTASALRLRVTPTPLAGASPNADFEILDFKGSQDILLEPKLRFPLRIEGTLPGMGDGGVDISSVRLR